MAEEKKKTTTKKTTKKETAKKAPAKKTTTTKTTSAVKTETKKTTPKKVETKKAEVKETAPKKEKIKVVETKEVKKTKKVEPKVEKKLTKEEQLERTMIFDGAQKKNLKEVVEKLEKENVVLKDKVVKRSKINKVIVIILIVLTVAVMATTAYYLGSKIKEKMDAEKTIPTLNTDIYNKVTEYRVELNEEETEEESEEETVIKEITLKQFENKILKKENINVLVSSNTCYFCIQFEPIVEETLKDSGKTIYKIDVAKMEENEVKQFREYYAFTITPTIFIVKDGIVTAEKLGSMDAETLAAWANENLQ